MIDRRILARLPLRFWLQLALGLALLCVLAVFGFALLLGGAVIVLGMGLVFQLMAWFRPRAPQHDSQSTIDGEYRVIERRDEHPR
jgi:hypothetical protein